MMWNDLTSILDFLFSIMDRFIVLYFSGGILSAVFCIYIVRKVSNLIDRLR